LPEHLGATYITQVLDGLIYLHDQGVIHRDIKGANILATKEGVVKLADFGVATLSNDTGDMSVAGTPYWSKHPLAWHISPFLPVAITILRALFSFIFNPVCCCN